MGTALDFDGEIEYLKELDRKREQERAAKYIAEKCGTEVPCWCWPVGLDLIAELLREQDQLRKNGVLFLNRERVDNVIERLTSMAVYAEKSLSPETILRDRVEALRHMLRGEIARLSDWTWIHEQKR